VAGVAVDSEDRIYVYNRGEHPVIVFDGDGNVLRTWGEGFLKHAHGIFVDLAHAIYLVDRFLHAVLKYSLEGELLMRIGTLNQPTDFFLDPAGHLYVAELQHRVSILNRDGEILTRLGGDKSHAPGQSVAPHAVWTDSKENLYVGEVLEGQRIQKFARIANTEVCTDRVMADFCIH
jgi:hypothetical protein